MPTLTAEKPHPVENGADKAGFNEYPYVPQLLTAGSGVVPPDHRITATASQETPRHESLGDAMPASEHRVFEAIVRGGFDPYFGRNIEADE